MRGQPGGEQLVEPQERRAAEREADRLIAGQLLRGVPDAVLLPVPVADDLDARLPQVSIFLRGQLSMQIQAQTPCWKLKISQVDRLAMS